MKDILNLTIEFAKKIQKTKEYLNLKKAKEINDKDHELKNNIAEFNELTENVKSLIKNSSKKEEIDEENSKISLIYSKIVNNENMINFNKASNEMNILMNKINNILIKAVNGEDFENSCVEFNCESCKKCSGKN